MGIRHHELKTLPCYFEPLWRGEKMFEIRDSSDRAFQKGDTVLLKEYDPDETPEEELNYSGREVWAKISFVTNYSQKEDYVVFGLVDPVNIDGEK